ncbi:MAG: hypothetical protein CFE24_01365 [Flavobacterium sp. BFFFF2]|nr:MAG: hypothetical protein CFE24_01365 [Flavobacterium sp. BFFFF2]
MKIKIRTEIVVLIILTITNFFIIEEEVTSLLYVFLFIPTSIYYFPIKPIGLLTHKEEHYIVKTISCFVISLSLILAYITFLVGNKLVFIKLIYLIELIMNLFLISFFIQKKDRTYLLHVVLMSLNAMCYFGK